MKSILCFLLLFGFVVSTRAESGPVALFYMTESPSSARSFLAHSTKIGMLVPASYLVDGNGLISADPIPDAERSEKTARARDIYRDHTREWVFYTDGRTLDDRYKLAQDRGIQGFCAWVLGDEDPAIWRRIPDAKRK